MHGKAEAGGSWKAELEEAGKQELKRIERWELEGG
jgi:hypothetical protein